jgi:hypothetical protein
MSRMHESGRLRWRPQVVPRLRDGSAATVWGVPTDFIDGTFDGNRTMGVCINPRGTQHQRQGIQYSYSGLDVTGVVELHGMLVTTGVRSAFDGLRLAPWTDRALAWGDACIRFDLTTPTELAGNTADRMRWQGIRRVRALLPMLSALAESPMESVMRFVWVGAGFAGTARQPGDLRSVRPVHCAGGPRGSGNRAGW